VKVRLLSQRLKIEIEDEVEIEVGKWPRVEDKVHTVFEIKLKVFVGKNN
jgi:hypothetical protein